MSMLSRARRRYMRLRTARRLRWYLILKARTGKWDPRYCPVGVPTNVTAPVKRYITRGFAAGLVVTATRNGTHAVGSYHCKRPGRAADMGLRSAEVGTAKGRRKLERFQRAEFKRRHKSHPIELIGPVNNRIILRGVVTPLVEGTTLENQHDNHCHGAF